MSAHRARYGTSGGGLALCVLLCASLASCSSSPAHSAAAVCHVWGVGLHNKYAEDASKVSSEPLLVMIDVIRAPNDPADLIGNMAAVAPTSIKPDFQTLATAFQHLSSSEGIAIADPLGAIMSNVVSAVSVSGSYRHVNQYISMNCEGPGTSQTS